MSKHEAPPNVIDPTALPAERMFGTDGIRGRYGSGWLRPDLVSAIARVLAELALDGRAGHALVGHDGRRSGPELERALAAGLAASGCTSSSAGLITTPGLAWLGREGPFDLTVMLSASHNPARDNGIKVFNASGEKLPDELEAEIETRVRAHALPAPDGAAPPNDQTHEESYLAHLEDSFEGLELGGATIALDCANGGGSRVAPRILGRLGAHVVAIASDPDGDNINENCGSTHPERLQEAVRLNGAVLGIALDGDGDRCILVDERGALVDGDGIMTVLALFARSQGRLRDPRVVATVMSNKGLSRALRGADIDVLTVGVGDRRVVEALRAESLELGGEQSGHIVCGADNHFIGDGTYTALRVLAAMRSTGKPLSELAAPFQAFPQVLLNVRVSSKPDFAELAAVTAAVEEVRSALGDDGRVLLRYSGTEPLARVMVEGPDQDSIRAQARTIAAHIEVAIGRDRD